MLAVASLALSTCVGLVLSANDLVIWDTNSTEMPTACNTENVISKVRTKTNKNVLNNLKDLIQGEV